MLSVTLGYQRNILLHLMAFSCLHFLSLSVLQLSTPMYRDVRNAVRKHISLLIVPFIHYPLQSQENDGKVNCNKCQRQHPPKSSSITSIPSAFANQLGDLTPRPPALVYSHVDQFSNPTPMAPAHSQMTVHSQGSNLSTLVSASPLLMYNLQASSAL